MVGKEGMGPQCMEKSLIGLRWVVEGRYEGVEFTESYAVMSWERVHFARGCGKVD